MVGERERERELFLALERMEKGEIEDLREVCCCLQQVDAKELSPAVLDI